MFASPLRSRVLDLAGIELAQALGRLALAEPSRLRELLAAARALGAAPVAICGDSHSVQYIRRDARDGRWLLPVHLCCSAGSARGLANPGSRSGYGVQARAFAEAVVGVPVVWKFGQVDIEFVFAFKRLEGGGEAYDAAEFAAFARETIDRYLAFLCEVTPSKRRSRAYVATVFPPALSDGAWRQGYVNAHAAALHTGVETGTLAAGLKAMEIPDLTERTRQHALFNRRLEAGCADLGFAVLDDFAPMLGGDGRLEPSLLGRGAGSDHHLGYSAGRSRMLAALWSVARS